MNLNKTNKKLEELEQNIETTTEINDLAETMLDLGTEFLLCGSEVSRVEDMLEHIGMSFGAVRVNVFVITSCILLTIYMPDGKVITQTRNVHRKGGTDFFLLEELNELSRECYRHHISLKELRERFNDIKRRDAEISSSKSFAVLSYFASIAVASGFTVFFGGGWEEALAAAVPALFICFMQRHVEKIFTNKIVFNLIASILAGILVCLIANACTFCTLKADIIMIGNIMLLIPGVAMTNAIRGMMMGDTISGLMRLVETLLWSGSLAAGFVIAILIAGGSAALYNENLVVSPVVQLVSVFVGVAGLCLLFRLKKRHWLPASLAALPVYAVYLIIAAEFHGTFFPNFAATALAALFSEILAVTRKAPATLFVIPTVLSLVPGGGLFYMMSGIIRKNPEMFSQYTNTTITIAVAIAFGILIVFTFWDMVRQKRGQTLNLPNGKFKV